MVVRWLRGRAEGWRRSTVINGVGGVVTAAVFVIILITKFTEGGWMVVVAIPLLTLGLFGIGRFYRHLDRAVFVPSDRTFDFKPSGSSRRPIIVPVEDITLPTVTALEAASRRSSDVVAVHVNYDPEDEDHVIKRWPHQFPNIPLVVIDSPYRIVAEPLSWYVQDRLRDAHGVTLVIPTIQVRKWWQRPLVNQSLRRLRSLLQRRRTVTFEEEPFPVG
jgi:hypothetical protein